MQSYLGVRDFYAETLTSLLISDEFLIGSLLGFRRSARIGALASGLCGFLFLSVNLIRVVEGTQVPCSCFGQLFQLGPLPLIAIDSVIILLSLYVWQQHSPGNKT